MEEVSIPQNSVVTPEPSAPTALSGKNELLNWVNGLLQITYQQIENLGNGAAYCQIFDILFPGEINMSNICWNGKTDYDFMKNYQLVGSLFSKKNIPRNLDPSQLSKCKYQDNLQFCQWLKKYYDETVGDKATTYDPVSRRGQNVPSITTSNGQRSQSPFQKSMSGSMIQKKASGSTPIPLVGKMMSSSTIHAQTTPNSTNEGTKHSSVAATTSLQASSKIARPATGTSKPKQERKMEQSIANPLQRKIVDVQPPVKKDLSQNKSLENKENVSNRGNLVVSRFSNVPKGGVKDKQVDAQPNFGDKELSQLLEKVKAAVSFESSTSSDEQIAEIRRLFNICVSSDTMIDLLPPAATTAPNSSSNTTSTFPSHTNNTTRMEITELGTAIDFERRQRLEENVSAEKMEILSNQSQSDLLGIPQSSCFEEIPSV